MLTNQEREDLVGIYQKQTYDMLEDMSKLDLVTELYELFQDGHKSMSDEELESEVKRKCTHGQIILTIPVEIEVPIDHNSVVCVFEAVDSVRTHLSGLEMVFKFTINKATTISVRGVVPQDTRKEKSND